MKRLKKVLAVMLSCLMCASLCTMTVRAEGEVVPQIISGEENEIQDPKDNEELSEVRSNGFRGNHRF